MRTLRPAFWTLSTVLAVAGARAEAAALTGPHRYVNTTGTAVNDLHVTFRGTGGTLHDPVITEQPEGANGRIRIGDPPANTVILEWPTEIRPGEAVAFKVRSRFRPIRHDRGFWTRDGQPVGEATPVEGSGDQTPEADVRVVESPPGTKLRVTMDAKASNLVPATIEVLGPGNAVAESYLNKFQSSTATGVMHAAYVANRNGQGLPVWFATLRHDGYSTLTLHVALGEPAKEGGEQLTLTATGLPEGFLTRANDLLAVVESQPPQPALSQEWKPQVAVTLRRGTKTVTARAVLNEPATLEPWFELRRVLLQTRLHQHLTRAAAVQAAARVESSLGPPVMAHTLLTGLRLQRMLQLNGPEWTRFVPSLLAGFVTADFGSLLARLDLARLLYGDVFARTCKDDGPSMRAWPGDPAPENPQLTTSSAWRLKAQSLAAEIIDDKIRPMGAPSCVEHPPAVCACQLKDFKAAGPVKERVVSWDGDPPPWRHSKVKSGEPHENKPATGPAGPIGLPGGFYGDPFGFLDMDVYTRKGTLRIQDFDTWFLTVTITCSGPVEFKCRQGDQTHTRRYFDIIEPPVTTTREVTESLNWLSLEFIGGSKFEHHPPEGMPPDPNRLTPKVQ